MKLFRFLCLFLLTIFVVKFSVIALVTNPNAAESPTGQLPIAPPITKKVYVLNFDPYISGTTPLSVYQRWGNFQTMQTQYITEVRNSSHGIANYQIVRTDTIRNYPVKPGGFVFTNAQYLSCLTNPNAPNCFQLIDYNRLLSDYNVCDLVNNGTIDEVWLWGGPYFGYLEAVMAGPGAFFTNGGPVTNTTCNRKVNIMGFNYDSQTYQMLHSLGHRIEGTMEQVYGRRTTNLNTSWNRFSMTNRELLNQAGCGNVHFPHNGLFDYDYTNQASIVNSCNDLGNYPSTNGSSTTFNCSIWGCSEHGYVRYWLNRIPYRQGTNNNKLNNWWAYVLDYDSAVNIHPFGDKWYAIESGENDKNLVCGSLNHTDNEVYLGKHPTCSTGYEGIFVYPDVRLQRFSNIPNAYMEFVGDGPYNNSVTLSITASDGVTTSSPISWNLSSPWVSYNLVRSVDIAPAISQLVNSGSWQPGRTVTISVKYLSGTGTRRVFAVNRRSLAGARLITNSITPPAVLHKDSGGVFRPSNGALYLKNSNTTGVADIQINYGIAGDKPIVGDWNGDGIDTIGIFRNGVFHLRNSNTIGVADITFGYGMAGDQPIVGDWNRDGRDTVGIYKNGTFYLRNSNSTGASEITLGLGIVGDLAIAGDWNGDGFDTVGVFRPTNGALYLKNSNTTGVADIQINYGIAGDKPVVGDWNNDGKDTIGVYRNGNFYLRNSNTIGVADVVFALGLNGDVPIAGNWDGLPR